jgi:hypothetical protein
LKIPKIWGEIKIVLREGWQRSAIKFIEMFPNKQQYCDFGCDLRLLKGELNQLKTTRKH